MSANDKFKAIVGGFVGIPVGVAVGVVSGTVAGVAAAINTKGDAGKAFGDKFGDVLDDCVKGSVDIVMENADTVAALVVTGVAGEMKAEAQRKCEAEARRKQRLLQKGQDSRNSKRSA